MHVCDQRATEVSNVGTEVKSQCVARTVYGVGETGWTGFWTGLIAALSDVSDGRIAQVDVVNRP